MSRYKGFKPPQDDPSGFDLILMIMLSIGGAAFVLLALGLFLFLMLGINYGP